MATTPHDVREPHDPADRRGGRHGRSGRTGGGGRSLGPRPNVIVFLCDDLGSGDLSCLGSRHVRTPHIDALFARGTRLERHWAGSAVCAPSRCVLMTGRHSGHAVVRSNRQIETEGQAPMPAGTVTLPALLCDAGYATGGFGKWGLGPPGRGRTARRGAGRRRLRDLRARRPRSSPAAR